MMLDKLDSKYAIPLLIGSGFLAGGTGGFVLPTSEEVYTRHDAEVSWEAQFKVNTSLEDGVNHVDAELLQLWANYQDLRLDCMSTRKDVEHLKGN